jgi:DNA-nicking Smr family endonuclease
MGQTVSNLASYLWDAFPSPPKPGEPGYQNRQEAFSAAEKARVASQQSQTAYKNGDHQGARNFSTLSKSHWNECNRLHSLAETEIFTHHNPTYPTNLTRIDLHGLLVKEAIARVEKHVELCKWSKIPRTVVVTGRGSHSKDGLAKIKPAIQELCRRESLRVFVDEPNVGCMTVEIGVAQANNGKDCLIM